MAVVRARLDASKAARDAAAPVFADPDFAVAPREREPCPQLCQVHQTHLYVCCFPTPTVIRERDWHPADRERVNDPLSHYVGYTSQLPPIKRVKNHTVAAAHAPVLIVAATEEEEYPVKRDSMCLRCDRPLWYYRAPQEAKPDEGQPTFRARAPLAKNAEGDDYDAGFGPGS